MALSIEGGGRVFGHDKFAPKYIFIQIMVLLSSFYSLFLTISLLLHFFISWSPLLISQVMTAENYNPLESLLGVELWIAILISSAWQSFIIKFVVERTRKVLDFVLTCHIITLLIKCIFSDFPMSIAWWLAFVATAIFITIAAERLCMQEEQKAISLANI